MLRRPGQRGGSSRSYEASHPNVKITYDNAPHANFEQKVLTAFAGGAGPDVFWAGDWMIPQFVANGIVAPVDPTAFGVQTQEEFVNLFEPGSLDAFTVDDKVYTGGISEYNTFTLIYDKDDFAEAGIELPSKDTPMTWEQLADIAAKLTKKEGDKTVRIGMEYPYDVPIWTVLIQEPMLRQLGGELINPETGKPDFTQEAMVKVMTYVQDLVKQGGIDPALTRDLLGDLANDRASIIIGGPWAAKPLNDLNPDLNWDTAPLPQFADAKDRITTLYAWAWFVSGKSSPEKQKAAWEFVNLLTSNRRNGGIRSAMSRRARLISTACRCPNTMPNPTSGCRPSSPTTPSASSSSARPNTSSSPTSGHAPRIALCRVRT